MQLFIDLGDFCLSEGVDLLVGETLQRQMLISLVLFLFFSLDPLCGTEFPTT